MTAEVTKTRTNFVEFQHLEMDSPILQEQQFRRENFRRLDLYSSNSGSIET